MLRVVDGDTIQLGTPGEPNKPGETVRLIGIDTPERGRPQCAYDAASNYLRELIGTHGPTEVTLTTIPGFKRDRYQRLLRYVSAHGIDLGLAQIQAGHAIARYDSRTRGYKRHPRQDTYIAADAASPAYVCSPSPTRTPSEGNPT